MHLVKNSDQFYDPTKAIKMTSVSLMYKTYTVIDNQCPICVQILINFQI